MIFILVLVVFAEVAYQPRLDCTRDRDLLLWYGRDIRNYCHLFKVPEL